MRMGDQSNSEQEQLLKEINISVDELPLLPSAISKLMALSISDTQYFEKVQHLTEQDPTFAIRLIKLANSVKNAPVAQITSLKHAVARVGTRQIKGLATTFAVTNVFVPTHKSELDLWVHSIQVAVASQSIARMSPHLNINPEQAYLCGLLHDIGRFILFSKISDGPIRIDEKNWESPENLIEAEQEVCGLDHAKLGGDAARKWDLPSMITNVISNHHNYSYLTTTQLEKKEAEFVRVVQMADYFSMLLLKDPNILSLEPKELQQLIAEKCKHPSWDTLPISALLLQNEAQNIYDTASQIVAGLDICLETE